MMNFGRRYLIGSIVVAFSLCAAQIFGSALLIWGVLALFVALILFGCLQGFTLPLLMFFLPWARLLRPDPSNFSLYTLGLVMICALDTVKNWHCFKRYHIETGILLVLITLLSKLISGYKLAVDYICFMMMIVLFPILRVETTAKKYSFYDVLMFFAVGVVAAALCAQQVAGFHNIAKYIRVDSYNTIVRRCGFYGDPNFYSAHITAALSGCLLLVLQRPRRGERLLLGAIIMLLLYCGFLSGSKSFVLTTALVIVLWTTELLRRRGQTGFKLALILCGILVVIYVATSSLFSDLIGVVVTRFRTGSFTTGRTDLWISYLNKMLDDVKVLFLGEGFTDVTVNSNAAHNTILQMVFQFGLIGAPILLRWIWCYFKTYRSENSHSRKTLFPKIVLLTGVLLPWMALDVLFFDEFFLMQWFCVQGFQNMEETSLKQQPKAPAQIGHSK